MNNSEQIFNHHKRQIDFIYSSITGQDITLDNFEKLPADRQNNIFQDWLEMKKVFKSLEK